ncbi:MAG: HAMP domain-containing protein [Methylococcales bacterium]|nr:HAMP domain-containing protein [Methylococcales bacterium]MCK5925897.1 HAMP domain-containing protein [Methylococcales bacterium]
MSLKNKDNLQRTMIMYFMLIVCAALLVTVEFVFDVQSVDLKNILLENFKKLASEDITKLDVFEPLEVLRNKAIIMIGIIMFVTIIVLTMLIKNITGPLQHMIDLSKKISDGDLTQTIDIDSNNELSQLGGVINEMSTNLQEVTMISKNMSDTGERCISHVRELLAEDVTHSKKTAEILIELEQLQDDFETLKFFTECFQLKGINGDSDA